MRRESDLVKGEKGMRKVSFLLVVGLLMGAGMIRVWRRYHLMIDVGRGWIMVGGKVVSENLLTEAVQEAARRYPPTSVRVLRRGRMVICVHRHTRWGDVTRVLNAVCRAEFCFLRIFWAHPDVENGTPFLVPLGAAVSPPMWWDLEGNAHLGFPPENSYQLYVRLKREGNTVTADFGKHPILLRSERDWGVVRGFLKRITAQSEDQPIFVRVHSEPDVAAGVVLRLLETLRSFYPRVVNIALLSADSLPIIELGN